jgi:hypothetical protein
MRRGVVPAGQDQLQERCAKAAGEVMAPFTPVEASATDCAAPDLEAIDVEALGQKSRTAPPTSKKRLRPWNFEHDEPRCGPLAEMHARDLRHGRPARGPPGGAAPPPPRPGTSAIASRDAPADPAPADPEQDPPYTMPHAL